MSISSSDNLPSLPKKIKDAFKDTGKLPETLKNARQSDSVSFYIKPNKMGQIPDRCANYHIDTGLPSIDLINGRGRKQGLANLYNADQVYNYTSQSQRYEKVLNLAIHPDNVKESNGITTYYFCSSDSPTGYWEVTVGGNGTATYITFGKNPLTIICPAPFKLSSLALLSTDSTTIQWTQIAGNRTVLIENDTDFDPTIDIQLTCYTNECQSASLSPLILRAQTDNDLLFADLYIFNRLIDNFYGLGYAAYQDDAPACRKINSVQIVPKYQQKAYVWIGDALRVTWTNPACDAQFLTGFQWEYLQPPYVNDSHYAVGDTRLKDLMGNIRYRLVTEFNIYGNIVTATSDPIFFDYGAANPLIFADDVANVGLGYAVSANSYSKIEIGVQSRQLAESAIIGLGYAVYANVYIQLDYGVQTRQLNDTAKIGVGYSIYANTYNKVNLGGIIIG